MQHDFSMHKTISVLVLIQVCHFLKLFYPNHLFSFRSAYLDQSKIIMEKSVTNFCENVEPKYFSFAFCIAIGLIDCYQNMLNFSVFLVLIRPRTYVCYCHRLFLYNTIPITQ